MTSALPISPLAEAPPAVLAVLGYLKRSEQYVARHGGDVDRIGLRKPAELGDQLWTVVRSAGGFPLAAAAGAWSRLVQVEVCAAGPIGDELPELATERVAGLAGALLDRARAEVFAGASWRAHLLDGPNDLTDTSRGADSPVWRQAVRVDVRMHAHV